MLSTELMKVDGKYQAELLLNTQPDEKPASPVYSIEMANLAYNRLSKWLDYSVTPLHRLTGAADELGIGALFCKDESRRLGLSSFKAAGAVYATVAEIVDLLEDQTGHDIDDLDLLAGKYSKDLEGTYLTCCTDGNHGFSVASAAYRMGCRCVIYIPAGVSSAREQALKDLDAEVIRIDGTYDEAYELAAESAAANPGAVVISDSATSDYVRVPAIVMSGYSVMIREIVEQLAGEKLTHVMLPAGCGGMAAAVIAAFDQLYGENAPKAIIVEPLTADCVFASALAGHETVVEGDLETIMGGLSCAAVSHIAWPTLKSSAAAFLKINDDAASEAVRFLANPKCTDVPVVAGETGGAGMAGILALRNDHMAMQRLGLDAQAKVLIINCEGATDPEMYRKIVGAPRALELGIVE